MSAMEMAEELGTYRQRIWRVKKELEGSNAVWGYTAVLDDTMLGHVTYLVLMKVRPISKRFCDTIINRVVRGVPHQQHIRLLNILFVNGEYDWVISFSAPDHATARRYYDSLRLVYEEHLLEKPVIIDINFSLMREGKVNPGIKGLYDFVP